MAPFTFTYPAGAPNAITFGGDNPFRLSKISGLSPVDIREDIADKSEADGSFIYALYRDYRRIVFDGDVAADDPIAFQALIDAMAAALVPQRDEQPLDYELGDGIGKRIYCRPSKIDIPIDPMYSISYGVWHVEFIAESPLILSGGGSGGGGGSGVGGTHSFTLTLAATAPLQGLDFGGVGGGLDFGGVGGGLDFGGGGGGSNSQGTATDSGNAASSPTARINGPVTNPILRNVTTGEALGFDITLASGDYLDIDFMAKTVVLNGTGNRYNTIDPTNATFWLLQPGDNVVQFSGIDADATTNCFFAWRDAWA